MIRTLCLVLALASAMVCTSTSYADGQVRTDTIRNPAFSLQPDGRFLDHMEGWDTYLPANDSIRDSINRARLRHADKMVVAYVVRTINGKKVKVIKGVVF